MYKKKQFLKISKKYSSYQDEGAVGAMMQLCHKKLDENNYITKLNKNSIILEIGAGTSPHIKYLMHDFKKYIFLENSKFAINFLKKKFYHKKKINFKIYDGKRIPFKNKCFDRIIISHVLEHISNPELFLEEMMKKLKKNAILSIALPTDPGVLWRVGRFFLKLFQVRRKLNISNLEYDYMIASEHINSIFNLVSIIRYKYKKNIVKEQYLPLGLRVLDWNLFYNVTLKK